MKICKHEPCDKKHDSHGYCANHARQFRKWGRIRTKEERRLELSERNKRVKPNLGKKWSEESKEAQSARFKGRTLNTGRTHFKKGASSWNKGLKGWLTPEHMGSLCKANIGKTPWNKDKRMEAISGENNWIWAGDKVSYRTLHKWVERYLGKPEQCSECLVNGLTGRQIHWSNISGKYKRDLSDWQRLCAKCHKAYDKKLKLARIGG